MVAVSEEKFFHRLFWVSISIKALGSFLELVAGAVLLLMPITVVISIVSWCLIHLLFLSQSSLLYAHAIAPFEATRSMSGTFVAAYLAFRGAVKVFPIAGLLLGKKWAYPLTFAILGGFIAYQCFELCVAPSFFLVALTAFDIFVVVMVTHEYRLHKKFHAIWSDKNL